jgi:hypothetical protein
MQSNTIQSTGNTLTPDGRERLQRAYHMARVRCGLADETESRGPLTMAGRFVRLLRRLGVAR